MVAPVNSVAARGGEGCKITACMRAWTVAKISALTRATAGATWTAHRHVNGRCFNRTGVIKIKKYALLVKFYPKKKRGPRADRVITDTAV